MGTGIQKRDQKKNGDKEGSGTPVSGEYGGPTKKTPAPTNGVEKKPAVELSRDNQIGEQNVDITEKESENIPRTNKDLISAKSSQVVGNGSVGRIDDVFQKKETTPKSDIKNVTEKSTSKRKHLNLNKSNDSVRDESIKADIKASEDASLKLKKEVEENLRKQEIERLADENFLRQKKIFVYPQVVKPDQDIEVFLNRSLSTLKNEPDVLIMGAFNDWRWKSFTFRLNKTHLKGDWWSCQVHVPKEAFKIDFVFFNGQNIYENNDQKDFCIAVEGLMDALAFEDFLLEEKRREQEKLAKEKAEQERQEEERRRIEAEHAAIEADRAQARVETERKREMLRELKKKAARSVDNVWYIEPSEFKGEDLVRLHYNKQSSSLAHAKELWIHGGYNNWKDGLSIVARLVSSERTDGDWWYAKGICRHILLSCFFLLALGSVNRVIWIHWENLDDYIDLKSCWLSAVERGVFF